ncbi:MAG: hypothetical protein IBJ09_09250 [Bacteroidia bacterium]|nr:hypothetical protein [Bacteroidia bacterium]
MDKKPFIFLGIGASLLLGAATFLFVGGGSFFSRPEKPGTLSNPRMAEMLNEALDQRIRSIGDSIMYPGYTREADDNARLFLKEVKEVVPRCTKGPNDNARFNKRVLDVTLNNGTVLEDQYTGESCYYMIEKPNIYRVFFKDGRVVDVQSDGREKERPVENFRVDANSFAEYLIKVDIGQHKDRYFPREKTRKEIRDEWEK